MRMIGSVEVGGVEYQALWASWPSTDNPNAGTHKALVVRSDDEKIQTTIRRNARLADVQASLRHLKSLGLKDSQLSRLFNFKGDEKGLPQHIKVLVSRLN